jgi:hypothetical protein
VASPSECSTKASLTPTKRRASEHLTQLQFNRTVQKVIENLTREQCRYLVRVTKADRLADLRGRVAAKFNAGELNISEIYYAFHN